MRLPRLALLSAAWLAVTGAAPLQSANDALVECRMPRLRAHAALMAIPERTDMAPRIKDGERAAPLLVAPDLQMFGVPVRLLVKTVDTNAPQDRFGMLTVVSEPYDAMEKRVLAGHGLSKCESRVAERGVNCVISTRTADGHGILFLMQQFDDGNVGISCNYYPTK